MEELAACFALETPAIVSLIGGGGKTSLMEYLADRYRSQKVLMGTTTKIAYPRKFHYDRLIEVKETFPVLKAQTGVTVLGKVDIPGKKFASLPLAWWEQLAADYDYTFLEADGSKRLPLKGWRSFEPVVLPATTVTIGVLPAWVLGHGISAELIHCLPEFLQATNSTSGETLAPEIIAQLVLGARGMFEKAHGRNILYFSQGDRPASYEKALKITAALKKDPRTIQKLERIIFGSIIEKKGEVLWQKQN
ncbi:MAG: putative selenium-dependent hydroxylase accessory protein YqeC [Enterococcaceae bacterium]|nr:putative selenium-dependent hydroxylase accessory protein YqeC [Enterococcaceae bacterium]MCI1920233.1 putative selenium-dependent hydroxylase accessory protein YqeC [Enterococcaceae bacterium]